MTDTADALSPLDEAGRTEGTVELLSAMDAVVFPVTGSPMDMEAVRHFIDILGEQILTMGKGNIRELYLLRTL